MRFFVSYTTRDKEVTVDLLQSFASKLKKTGYVFIDMFDNNSIDKQSRVIAELDNSDILILIESRSTYESEWVSVELERAKARKIPIKIVKIEELMNYM